MFLEEINRLIYGSLVGCEFLGVIWSTFLRHIDDVYWAH